MSGVGQLGAGSRNASETVPANDFQAIGALFEPVANPVLRSFDPKKVSAFLEGYGRYKIEVKELHKEFPTMTVASFKFCIERSRLESIHFIGKLLKQLLQASLSGR